MESNSGSLQSSSGDDEYITRAAGTSPFSQYFINPTTTVASLPNFPPLQPPPMFDPSLSGYSFDPLPVWSSIPSRSDPSPPIQTRNLPPPPMAEIEVRPPSSSSGPIRNTKKRSRASRRAPTTVLTTDTTNFRAMVQEFTGIPAPPFNTSSSSSSLPRTRLDLFSTSSSPYLLRPFAQKNQPQQLQPPPYISASSSSNNNSNNLTSINYQRPVVNSEMSQANPINLSFQTLLQTSHNQLGSRPQASDHFGTLSHGHSNLNNNELGDQGSILRSVNASYGNQPQQQQQQVMNCNEGNYLVSSSSDFHGDKGGSENVATRSEGMVESWLFSSD